ncbi:MAG: DUF4105 domain-containing protein [Bdellovibrionales bacterium]|nr:DUF4105 domain-containing protein [Bdellovibrionales bacterium]
MMRLAPFLFFLCFANIALGRSLSEAELKTLANSRQWRTINYYETNSLGSTKSKVLSDNFFISEKGLVDPLAELNATIEKQFGESDAERWICQYPARYQLIAESQGLDSAAGLNKCEELNKWKSKLNANSLSLVYPAQSLESSLSLFSHTFLKINDASKPVESSLHTVISYAANFASDESMMSLAFNGIFGGYAGQFGTSYFYDELLRYGYQETRDIFEYELNLTKKEIDRILNHLWEVQKTSIRYYFLDGNCSYYLLKLMEVGRPTLNLSEQFARLTIPAETVRVVVESSGLVLKTNYYPSKENKRGQRLAWMSQDERNAYSALTEKISAYPSTWANVSKTLGPDSQARVLDGFNDYLTFVETDEAVQLRPQVLADRSTISRVMPEKQFQVTRMRPEAGHKPHRIGLNYGEDENVKFGGIEWRLVLHDRIDPSPSYVENTDLEALKIDIRFQNDRLDLESLSLFKVLTIHPVTKENKQASSKFNSEISRPKTSRLANRHYFTNEYAKGIAVEWNRLTFYAMGVLALNYHEDLNENYQAGLGVEASFYLNLTRDFKFIFLNRYQDFSLGEKNHFSLNEGVLSWAKNTQQSWQLLMGRSDDNTYGKIQTFFYF